MLLALVAGTLSSAQPASAEVYTEQFKSETLALSEDIRAYMNKVRSYNVGNCAATRPPLASAWMNLKHKVLALS